MKHKLESRKGKTNRLPKEKNKEPVSRFFSEGNPNTEKAAPEAQDQDQDKDLNEQTGSSSGS